MALSHHDDVSAHLSEERSRRSSHCSGDAGNNDAVVNGFRGALLRGVASQARRSRPLNTEESRCRRRRSGTRGRAPRCASRETPSTVIVECGRVGARRRGVRRRGL